MTVEQRTVPVPVECSTVAATDSGSGPPILLLHGSNALRSRAAPLIDRLAPSFRCLAPDWPGAGESAVPVDASDPSWATFASDVLAVVRWAGASRPLVAGASWGGKIALAYAAAGYPCGGVFCVDGCAWGDAGTLNEDLYRRLACPVRMVFATGSQHQERDWPYTPETAAAFSARHPQLLLSCLPGGPDIGRQMPADPARLILDFARLVLLS